MAGVVSRLPHLLRGFIQLEAGDGAAHTLPLPTGPAAGTGRHNGRGAALTLSSFVDKPASGFPSQLGSGLAFSIASIRAGKPSYLRPSKASSWFLVTPSTLGAAEPLKLFTHLRTRLPYGLTLYRRDGAWTCDFAPNTDGADRVYEGGRIYPMTDEARAEIEDAGLGSYLTLMEIR